MTAAQLNLIIEKGCTFNRVIYWKDSLGNYIDLTNYIVEMEFRDKKGGTSVYTPVIVVTPLLSKIEITMSAEKTGAIKEFRLAYELKVTSPTGLVTKLLEGIADIRKGIDDGD